MIWSTSKPETTVADAEQWIRGKILHSPEIVWSMTVELLVPDERPTQELLEKIRGDEGPIIGSVTANGGPEVGFHLQPAFEGRGYGTEMLQGFLELFWSVVPRAPASRARPNYTTPAAAAAEHTGRRPMGPEAIFAQRLEAPPLKDGHDFIGAMTDSENKRSAKMLQKTGFRLWSSHKNDYESPNTGLRSTLVFQLARPGTELGPAPGPFELDEPS